MQVPYFGKAFVEKLRNRAEQHVDKYTGSSSWIEGISAGQRYSFESQQQVGSPPQLKGTEGDVEKFDSENARRIFEWVGPIAPALAMEERMWAYLTHVTFADYMHLRWPVTKASTIHRRYLFEGRSFDSLSHNGIARLWWAAALTRDAERSNPFELTDVLFHRQDIQVALLERSLGKCRAVRTGVLDFIRANKEWLARESFGRRIQLLVKELNMFGGVVLLDALTPSEIAEHLALVAERIAGPKPAN
jgi:hypothetical protein